MIFLKKHHNIIYDPETEKYKIEIVTNDKNIQLLEKNKAEIYYFDSYKKAKNFLNNL